MPSDIESLLEFVEKTRSSVRGFRFNEVERKVWAGKLHGLLQRYEFGQIRQVVEDSYADGKARFLSPNELGREVAERFGGDERRVGAVRNSVDVNKRFRIEHLEEAWRRFCREMAHIPADKMTRRRCLFVDEWVREMRQYSEPQMNMEQVRVAVQGVCGELAWSEWKGWTDRISDPRTMPSHLRETFMKFRAAMDRAPEVVE